MTTYFSKLLVYIFLLAGSATPLLAGNDESFVDQIKEKAIQLRDTVWNPAVRQTTFVIMTSVTAGAAAAGVTQLLNKYINANNKKMRAASAILPQLGAFLANRWTSRRAASNYINEWGNPGDRSSNWTRIAPVPLQAASTYITTGLLTKNWRNAKQFLALAGILALRFYENTPERIQNFFYTSHGEEDVENDESGAAPNRSFSAPPAPKPAVPILRYQPIVQQPDAADVSFLGARVRKSEDDEPPIIPSAPPAPDEFS